MSTSSVSQSSQALADIHAQCFAAPQAWSASSLEAMQAQSGVKIFSQANDAFLLVRMVADEMEILTLAVLPEHRRKGLATSLMQHAFGDAHQAGIRRCFLEVDAHNSVAIALYKRLHFEQIACRKDYYLTSAGRVDAVVMQRMMV